MKRAICCFFALCGLPAVRAQPRTELNHTTDPLGSTPGYRLLGYMPSRHSREVSRSILGIGYETLDRRTFDPKWTFPLVGELGVKSVGAAVISQADRRMIFANGQFLIVSLCYNCN